MCVIVSTFSVFLLKMHSEVFLYMMGGLCVLAVNPPRLLMVTVLPGTRGQYHVHKQIEVTDLEYSSNSVLYE